MGWFTTEDYDVDLTTIETPWEQLTALEKNMVAVFQAAHRVVVKNPHEVMPIVAACRQVYKRDEPLIEKQCHILWIQYCLAKGSVTGWNKVAFFSKMARQPQVAWRAG